VVDGTFPLLEVPMAVTTFISIPVNQGKHEFSATRTVVRYRFSDVLV
jgi:hypothetical protein